MIMPQVNEYIEYLRGQTDAAYLTELKAKNGKSYNFSIPKTAVLGQPKFTTFNGRDAIQYSMSAQRHDRYTWGKIRQWRKDKTCTNCGGTNVKLSYRDDIVTGLCPNCQHSFSRSQDTGQTTRAGNRSRSRSTGGTFKKQAERVRIEGRILNESGKAIQLEFKSGKEIWVPKSTMNINNFDYEDEGWQMFEIDDWILKKNYIN